MAPENDLTFLSESVRKQREIAQEALDQARQIDELIKISPDPETRAALEKIKAGALKITRELVANVTHTSSAVSSTIGFIDELVRK
ncbi:MAG: hypothetical protein ABSG76_08455 [Xanthobacteraceae bacterium]|jgi:hypothetical protein